MRLRDALLVLAVGMNLGFMLALLVVELKK